MNKYGAKRTEVDGISFDSKREANRYSELLLMIKAKQIHDLELQPSFDLKCGGTPILTKTGRQAKYRADFKYRSLVFTNWVTVEDVKGRDTPLSQLKRAIVKAEHGVDVVLV